VLLGGVGVVIVARALLHAVSGLILLGQTRALC
jgi:hypothetical protein